MTNELPWWHPELTDKAWCENICKEYEVEGSDEFIRDEWGNGAKYATLWDHVGEAYEQFEKLADAYLIILEAIDISGQDISPCMKCSRLVVCVPDGLPICEKCAIEEGG